MAIYAIGDVQGCYDELMQLLEKVSFDRQNDQLWFAGDLVNRGPKSLAVLEFVKSLGDRAVTVLGNHDLHLLAMAYGCKDVRCDPGMQAILDAPNAGELLDWLRHQSLFYHDPKIDCVMSHAGVYPFWDLAMAKMLAAEVEAVLRGGDFKTLLSEMYSDKPRRWQSSLSGIKRLRFIINAFTRMRFCDQKGRLELTESGAPGSQPAGLIPWFEVPGRRNHELKILFGHWSTLGPVSQPNIYPLDTGCVWGGQLSLMEVTSGGGLGAINQCSINCLDRNR